MRLLLIAAAALLAAPGAAAAAPKMYETDFKISVTAKQTTTWTYGGGQTTARTFDCQPNTQVSGNGKEVVTAKTSRPVLHRAYRTGRTIGFMPQGPQGARVQVGIDRTAAMRYVTAPSCGEPGGTTDGGPYDCAPLTTHSQFELKAEKGRLEVSEQALAPPAGWYKTCPIHYDEEHVAPGEVGPVSKKVPASDLFDPDFKQHIILFRKTYPFKTDEASGETTIRWEVTLRRTKPIKRAFG